MFQRGGRLTVVLLVLSAGLAGCVDVETPAGELDDPQASATATPPEDAPPPERPPPPSSAWPTEGGGPGRTYGLPGASFVGGETAWSYPLHRMEAPAATDGVRVYAGALDPCTRVIEGHCERTDQPIAAIDLATGEKIWERSVTDGIGVEPVLGDGAVFISAREVMALEADTGAIRWSVLFGRANTPAYADGRLFLTGNGVYAYDTQTGEQSWRWRPTTGGGTVSAPLVLGGLVVVSTGDAGIVALHAAHGAVAWQTDARGHGPVAASADGDRIVALDGDAALVALDPTNGSVLWQASLPEPVGRRLAVSTGTVVMQTRDNGLIAHDVATGQGLWRIDPTILRDDQWSVGDAVYVFGHDAVTAHALDTGLPVGQWPPAVTPSTRPTLVEGLAIYGTSDDHLVAVGTAR